MRHQNTTYTQYRSWSPVLGCNAVRVAMRDAKGGEFFAVVPQDGSARVNREMKNNALEQITVAIARGMQPGEVNVIPLPQPA